MALPVIQIKLDPVGIDGFVIQHHSAWLLAAVMQAGQKPDRLRITAQRLIWLIQRHKSMQARWFKHDVFDANVGVDLLII